MTQEGFNAGIQRLLRYFELRIRAALRQPTPAAQRKAVRALKKGWKEEHGTYYVGTYTVKAHFRKIPGRA